MRIGFDIKRINYYKTLGGTIDECLKRGYEAVLFLDETQFGGVVKKYPAPSEENVPRFLNGTPKIVTYAGLANLAKTVCTYMDIMVVHCATTHIPASVVEPEITYQYQLKKIWNKSIPIVSIYSHFYDSCTINIEDYESVDALCVLNQYSLDAYREILVKNHRENKITLNDYTNYIEDVFKRKVKITGSTLFDPLKKIYRKRKQEKAITKKAVFFLPKVNNHSFMRLKFKDQPRWFALIKSLILYNSRYFNEILKSPDFGQFLKSLERLIKRFDLDLVCKSRPKHGISYKKKLISISNEYHSGLEDNYYPAFTSHDILRKAMFSLHFRSFSVLESVIAGIPSLYFQIPILDEHDTVTDHFRTYVEVVRSSFPDNMFNFEGCVWNIPWEDSIDFLDEFEPNELVQDPDRRLEYIHKFCGIQEQSAAEKQVEVIESLF